MVQLRYPLVDPNPPRLSEHLDVLTRVEQSGIYSNNGPELRAFEAEATDNLFGGEGACLGVANATLGLMLAIRQAAGRERGTGKLALMPAFTFAATAQAAEWCGLTPLLADIDPDDWSMCPAAEERLLQKHAGQIAVVVPYATFGNAIDLDRYAWLMRRHQVGVVVDAAASLGIAVTRVRVVLFAATAAMTATMVSIVGSVGFVGLVIPHAARFLVGPGHARLLPATAMIGAIFMVLADIVSRVIIPQQILPIGVVTALFGAPAFAVLLYRARRAA